MREQAAVQTLPSELAHTSTYSQLLMVLSSDVAVSIVHLTTVKVHVAVL